MQPRTTWWVLAVLLGLAAFPAVPVSQVPTGAVTGVVTFLDGAPVDAATISLESHRLTRTGAVDADGRYEMSRVPAGLYRVSVESAGRTLYPKSDVAVVVWPDRRQALPLKLVADSLLGGAAVRPGATEINGVVVDQDGGPLPGVTVTLSGVGPSREVTTSVEGRYQFDNVTPGEQEVTAELAGFTSPGARRVPVVMGHSTTADFVLATGVGTAADEPARLARLDRFEGMLARWLATRPPGYQVTIGVQCFCGSTGPRRVRVSADAPSEPDADAPWRPASIEDVFDFVLTYIERYPYAFSVEYDEKYGFPTSLTVDVRRMTKDDELELFVRDFEPDAPIVQPEMGIVARLRLRSLASAPRPALSAVLLNLGGLEAMEKPILHELHKLQGLPWATIAAARWRCRDRRCRWAL
jgi:hypothetical protein